MPNKGRCIVIEGLEGAGKSTALQTIKRFLTELGINDIITTREPGGTRLGEAARQLIKETVPDEPLDPRAELLLLYASRVQLLECVIRPALLRGSYVLADRVELSTFAYQGGGRGLPLSMIQELSTFCLKGFQPDLIFFLDINPEEGLRRALKRSKADRIESEALSFFTDVYRSYHEHIKTLRQVVVIDASRPLLAVQHQIYEALQRYFIENCIAQGS